MREIWVRKASGERQLFEVEKLRLSLLNAGAASKLVDEIIADIMGWISDGASTKMIYSRAFSMLKRSHVISGLRYRLKQAIMEMGPTGYPFEYLIGRVFEKRGCRVEVGQVLEGKCVTHEVDVVATKDHHQDLVECKYHSDQGRIVSVQVPLYVRSRMDDIIHLRSAMTDYQGYSFSGWIATNTRFSEDSIRFGTCSGLHLLGWDYPEGNGLKQIIEREKIYPVTLLSQLTKVQKASLMDQGIVTCSQLLKAPEQMQAFNLSRKKVVAVMEELEGLN